MKRPSNEYLWSLVIEPGWIQSAIWNIEGEAANVVSVGAATHWDEETELLTAADTSLSAAIQTLPDDIPEPSKTVFGVPPSWVSEGQIKREHLDNIRALCSKLSLNPSGFVVLPEAIAHFTKSKEGVPLSAVIVGVGQDVLDITLFRLGNLAGTVNVARSVSVVDDVVEGLARFATGDPIPSRFLIYDGKEGELEEVKQALMAPDWTGDFPGKVKLLHTPQIEIVDPEEKVIAVCLAGASEMESVTSIKFDKPKDETVSETKEEPIVGLPKMPTAESVGFVANEDIGNVRPMEEVKKVNYENVLGGVKKRFGGIKLPSIPMGGGKRPFMLIGIIALVLLLGFLAAWWFVPKAQVTVFVSPKKLSARQTIKIDPEATGVSLAEGVIPGKIVKTTVAGEKTRSTTGAKTIGDRAKGSVTIRNGTANNLNLVAGTTLLSANNLRFTLDKSASVSAALSPSTPGSATIPATAADIGAAFNLAKGETFKVSNYPKSDVDGIVETDFSGGNSREIVAVSKDDMGALEADLTDELTDGGKKELSDGLPAGQIFISESASASPTDKNFSHKVGDETSTLKLNLTLSVSGIVVARSDLNNLASALLKEQIPSGFVLREEQMSVDFGDGKETGGVWEFETSFIVNLLPEVKTDEIKKAIAGKFPPLAHEYLATIPGFARAQIKLSPRFPGPFGTLPRILKNISVGVEAEK